jgi:tRNA (pseudouridine54-N1)-methyltransferase
MIGREIYNIRTDEATWKEIILKILSGEQHPGIYVKKEGIEPWLEQIAKERRIFVLHEKGIQIKEIKLRDEDCFIIGDNVGLPRNLERLIIRLGGEKLSLGKKHYLASQVIQIINYIHDVYGSN